MIINLKKAFILLTAIILTATAIYICPVLADEFKVELPILMYHHLSENNSKLNKYTISPSEFKSDLEFIQKNGYTTISINDLVNFTNGQNLPEKPIMITFDDGYQSVYKYAYPMLKERNMKAVANVIGKYAEMYSNINDENVSYAHINFEHLSEMVNSSLIEVGNHTYDMHTGNGIKNASDTKLKEDISQAQNLFVCNLHYTPKAFAYPFGKISKQALPILKEMGFKAVFCCWEKVNKLSGNAEELYHLNRFNRPHGKSAEKILTDLK